MSVTEVKQAAADLPIAEQADLAAWLLDYLTDSSGENAINDSIAEARLRQAELNWGQSTLLSADEFWNNLDR